MERRDDVMFKPIGVVHTNFSDEDVRKRVAGGESVIEIYPEYEAALDGLTGFSHIFVISHFDRLRPEQIGPLKVRPRSKIREGVSLDDLPWIGVLALDSPTRPNPIGLSLVSVVKIDRNRIVVSGLDLFDGTPVLDIKPYKVTYRAEEFKLPDWHAKLSRDSGRV